MRTVLALILLPLLPAAALAARIEGETLACGDRAYQDRILSAASDDDTEAVKKLVLAGILQGKCARLKPGTRIRVEKNDYPFACVTVFGTGDDCLWVRQRNVDVRN